MEQLSYLTMLKPTGHIHLGNYVSVIQTMKELSKHPKNILFLGIADYHAITNHQDPNKLNNNIYHLILTWLSSIPDVEKKINDNQIYIYRQSNIPQIFELFWIMSCYTAKGLCNRNHTYKHLSSNNNLKSNDPDKNIFMGLFNYPVLMSADILLFNTDYIPLGPDQKQHLEMSRDIANKFNHIFKTNILKQPKGYFIDKSIEGYDGRKMSKSYNNTIPIISSEKKLRKNIFKIKTNSKTNESKYENESPLLDIYKYFSNKNKYNELLNKMGFGLQWKEIKEIIFNSINEELKGINDKYKYFDDHKNVVYKLLNNSEYHLKQIAKSQLDKIKYTIGIN